MGRVVDKCFRESMLTKVGGTGPLTAVIHPWDEKEAEKGIKRGQTERSGDSVIKLFRIAGRDHLSRGYASISEINT